MSNDLISISLNTEHERRASKEQKGRIKTSVTGRSSPTLQLVSGLMFGLLQLRGPYDGKYVLYYTFYKKMTNKTWRSCFEKMFWFVKIFLSTVKKTSYRK